MGTHKGIGVQLTALVASFAVVLTLVVAGLAWQSRRTMAESAALAAAADRRSEAQMGLVDAVAQVQAVAQRLVREKDVDAVEKLLAESAALSQKAESAIREAGGAGGDVEGQFRAMTAANQKAFDRLLLGDNALAQEIFVGESAPAFAQLLAAVRSLQTSEQQRTAAQRRSAESRLAAVQTSVAVGALLIAALLCVAGLLAVRRITRTITTATAELAESTDQIAQAAAQVSTSSQSLADGSSQQAASLEETAASAEEVNSMSHQNANNARDISATMMETATVVDGANQRLGEMVESMQGISDSSEKVSRIIRVIEEIAFQTNILALNAAVEAARAGEAGMGFAVVADEVRSLAQRSSQAAQDTTSLIQESISRAADGRERLNHVTTAMQSVTDKATRVKTLLEEVANGSQEQARGMQEIAKAVMSMEKASQGVAAHAEQSAAAGEQLSSQCESLRGVVAELMTLVGGARQEERRPAAPAA